MFTGKATVKDEVLVVMLKEGRAYAYDLLYERYWKELYFIAYQRLGEEEIAKDLVQNLLIDIWKRQDTIIIKDSLQQFLYGAMKLQILNHYRSEQIKQKALDKALEHMHQVFNSMNELSSYYNLEKVVEEEVMGMPHNMKHSFLLRNDNHSVKEIAGSLNIAEQTVSNNISEALRRLRKRLVLEYPDRHLTCFALFLYCLTNNL